MSFTIKPKVFILHQANCSDDIKVWWWLSTIAYLLWILITKSLPGISLYFLYKDYKYIDLCKTSGLSINQFYIHIFRWNGNGNPTKEAVSRNDKHAVPRHDSPVRFQLVRWYKHLSWAVDNPCLVSREICFLTTSPHYSLLEVKLIQAVNVTHLLCNRFKRDP